MSSSKRPNETDGQRKASKRKSSCEKIPAEVQTVKQLCVFTDFSGIESPILALEGLGVRFVHAGSCEKGLSLRKFILKNFQPLVLYKDAPSAARPSQSSIECATDSERTRMCHASRVLLSRSLSLSKAERLREHSERSPGPHDKTIDQGGLSHGHRACSVFTLHALRGD